MLRTSDGGARWQDVTPKGMPRGASDIQFLIASTGRSHAWVSVNSVLNSSATVVYRTSDGGRHWRKSSTGQAGAVEIQFLSASTGFLLTAPQGGSAGLEWVNLLGTTDGGRNWRMLADGRPTSRPTATTILNGGNKSGFTFLDAKIGWITGNSGAVPVMLYATRDGGAAWHLQSLSVPSGFSRGNDTAQSQPPVFFGSQAGVLPVWFFSRGGVMDFYRTADGGRTWTPTTPVGNRNWPLGYSVIDQEHIVVAYGSNLYRSADGGRVWRPVHPDVSLRGATSLDFVNARDGWAIVDGRLLRTTDGGVTWTPVNPRSL